MKKNKEENRRLVPVVVQDANTQDVLMLAYADQKALQKTRKTKTAWFYSRSRRRLWKKGETSGNTMAVLGIRWDCDRDALLYQVEPKGPACHTGSRTCFGTKAFSLQELHDVIRARKQSGDASSYTARLLKDGALLGEKIREEADELVKARTKSEVAWEAADVMYFTLVRMATAGVTPADVLRELKRRNRIKTVRA